MNSKHLFAYALHNSYYIATTHLNHVRFYSSSASHWPLYLWRNLTIHVLHTPVRDELRKPLIGNEIKVTVIAWVTLPLGMEMGLSYVYGRLSPERNVRLMWIYRDTHSWAMNTLGFGSLLRRCQCHVHVLTSVAVIAILFIWYFD